MSPSLATLQLTHSHAREITELVLTGNPSAHGAVQEQVCFHENI